MQVAAGGRLCVLDLQLGARWKVPARLLTQLVTEVSTPSSTIFARGSATAELDADAGVVVLDTAAGKFERLDLGADGSLTRTVLSPSIGGSAVQDGRGKGANALPRGADGTAGTMGPTAGIVGTGSAAVQPAASSTSIGTPTLLVGAVLAAAAIGTLLRRRLRLLPTRRFQLVHFKLATSAAGDASADAPPVARHVDLSGIVSLAQLRRALLDEAADLAPWSTAAQPPSLEMSTVDAHGECTRLSGRAMLGVLQRADELTDLHVTIGGGRGGDALPGGP